MRYSALQVTLSLFLSIGLAAFAATPPVDANEPSPLQLTDQQKEEFLRTAKVLKQRQLSVGVTGTQRLTMTDGKLTLDAHFQRIDESKAVFQGQRGNELIFRDCYKFNVAAYMLDRMIGLNMVPVSIVRRIGGRDGALTWWVPDVAMMERDRTAKKIAAPDPEHWNSQMCQVRVFNELVYNMDANQTNLLITKDWHIWAIDFSRAFRRHDTIRFAANLTHIDRGLLEHIRKLDANEVRAKLKPCLMEAEIKGLLARRDKIVAHFDDRIARLGEAEVIRNMPAR
jgi:hypothetical protein